MKNPADFWTAAGSEDSLGNLPLDVREIGPAAYWPGAARAVSFMVRAEPAGAVARAEEGVRDAAQANRAPAARPAPAAPASSFA